MSNNAKNAMKHSENTTKTCLEVLKNVLKRLFLVHKSGSRLRCRTILKKHETLRKHQLNMFWGFLRNFWKYGSRLSCRTMLKKTPTKHVLRLFEKFLKIRFSAQKMWFSALISNYAKIPWNTPTIHVLSLFNKFLKIRFSAQKSGSRPRCRTMLKKIWNTQKTPTKHPLRHFKNFLKIRFLAEKSGSRLRCRIMLKYHETLRKHQLNMFWGFLRNSWKSGSRLKNPVLGSDFELC